MKTATIVLVAKESEMDTQFKTLCEIAEKHGVTCWANHGTLLGMMREGRLLAHDADIDVSIWAEDEARFREMFRAVRAADYRITAFSYHGMNFLYKFAPPKDSGLRQVDFHLMRRAGRYAWRPQVGLLNNPFQGWFSTPYGLWTKLLWKYVNLCPIFSRHASITAWPMRGGLQIGTCWTPAHFFENLTKLEGWNCHIPKDWDEYLTFKYRDWRTPHEGYWNYWTMEGGLIHRDPLEMVAELEEEKEQGHRIGKMCA